MKKTKHSEEKIIAAVKQLEAGRSAKELARELGFTDQTLYNWRSKYSGMDVSDAKRLKALEEENRRPKTMVAGLSLDKEAWKAVIRKNVKRIYRLYRQAHLAVQSLQRKRLERAAPVKALLTAANQEWGLDFVSDAVASGRGIALVPIQPGRPMQSGYVESFHGRLRDECLNANWFLNVVDAKEKIERWRVAYNSDRPHSRQ
ncbi:MAG TPA: integrase core domain-containing protein [Bryobacteraceae bacterium]|nr:integrase core domain-containing protein [Bryobacteraceae bacterium]